MKLFGKIYFYAAAVVLLAWLLPWLYALCTAEPKSTPFTLYSCVVDDFASLTVDDDGRIIYFDRKGHHYNDAQFDSILPMFYYRQLLSEGRMPDTLRGVAIDADKIQHNNFNVRLSPLDINKTLPKLYMMLESMPKRVDLEEPVEAFRSTAEGLEFIDMESNTLNAARSREFTDVMKRKGFVFPIGRIHGNPTTMKGYDEGYVMIDSRGALFHVKQISGKPYVRAVSLPDSVKVEQLMITEFPNRRTLAYIFTADNRLAILDADYNVHKTGVSFNPYRQSLTIVGDMFHYTVKVADEKEEHYYALDASTYATVDHMVNRYADDSASWSEYVFPFKVAFTSYNDGWVYPRVSDFSAKALPLGLLLAALLFFLDRRQGKKKYLETLFVLLLGIYIFIPLILIKKRN